MGCEEGGGGCPAQHGGTVVNRAAILFLDLFKGKVRGETVVPLSALSQQLGFPSGGISDRCYFGKAGSSTEHRFSRGLESYVATLPQTRIPKG